VISTEYHFAVLEPVTTQRAKSIIKRSVMMFDKIIREKERKRRKKLKRTRVQLRQGASFY
jgi:CRISPR/Cas system-associated endonuclease Cas3-HD